MDASHYSGPNKRKSDTGATFYVKSGTSATFVKLSLIPQFDGINIYLYRCQIISV